MIKTVDALPLEKTAALEARARKVIPCVTQTASKRPDAYAPGRFPTYIARGHGSHVWDVDGNEYIDCLMALGPVLLGYCYPAVDRAIAEQLARGIMFSRPTALEVEVAELLVEMVPCAEAVRFLKGGAEANAAALRMARAYTGREIVLTCGYRGWHDQWAVLRHSPGIPEALSSLTLSFAFNDLPSLQRALEAHSGQVAAVMIDPVARDAPKPGFLEGTRKLAHQHGALLILDEIVTGFRLARGGAQEHYGVQPDMAVFAKALANGMPLAAVTGPHDVIAAGNAISLTYGDEALSLAAAKAALTVQLEQNVAGHIWRVGRALVEGLQAAVDATGAPFALGAVPPMPTFVETGTFQGKPLTEEDCRRAWVYLLAELARRGVISRRNTTLLPSYSHTDEDVDHVVRAFGEALEGLARLLRTETLAAQVGDSPEPSFRRL
jgi:glutamate-1-semialdehyde aminotransferase